MSFAGEIRRAVMASPQVELPKIRQAMYKAFAASQISDAEAEELDALINARAAIPAPGKPIQRRSGSRPRSSASMERRRSWAASGRLPNRLAARFTLAEQSVLNLIAAEVQKRGACRLTVSHIAALAGVSESTVRNAVREAKAQGLLMVEESRRTAWMSNPNKITILSKEWAEWLRLTTGSNSYTPRQPESKSGAAQRRGDIHSGGLIRQRQDPAEPIKGFRRSRGG
jgi:hypothetical protein